MKRNLLLLNLLLAGLCGLAGWRLKTGYEEELKREEDFLRRRAAAEAAPVVVVTPTPPQLSAMSYLDIATRLLFSKDRNPTVVVEVEKPKPLPPLPKYYGMINFGDAPKVVLSAGGEPQRSYLAGAQVGQFKLLTIGQSGLEFEWEGRKVSATYAELKDLAPPPPPPAPTSSAPAQGAGATAKSLGDAQGEQRREGPDLRGTKPCDSGDNAPAGTVRDGYRKMISDTPFAKVCRWEKVN